MSGVVGEAPKYTLEGQLGSGGMAVVHLGTLDSPVGRRKVAIKRLLAGRAAASDATERIIAEARLVFRLTHANICQVLDLATSDEDTYLVMEFVDGCDLQTLLRRLRKEGRALDVAACVFVLREVARALDYAHRRCDDDGQPMWLVHGDVKPQNILLSRDGEVKLADFGISRALGAHAPGNQLVGGTPGFIAPEAERGKLDQRSDLYSLGATLFAALTGDSPAQDTWLDLASLAARRADAPRELLQILERTTMRVPSSRPATAAELERALSLLLAHNYPTFSASTLGDEVRKTARDPRPTAEAATVGATLLSLTHAVPASLVAHATSPSVSRPGTAPVVSRKQRKTTRAVLLASGVLLLAGSARLVFWSAPVAPVAPAAPAAPAAPVAVPPPVSSPSAAMSAPPAVVATPAPAREAVPPARHKSSHPSQLGYLTVHAEPWGAVYVDGKRISDHSPIYRVPVPVGAHRVQMVDPDGKRRSGARGVTVRAGENSVLGFEW